MVSMQNSLVLVLVSLGLKSKHSFELVRLGSRYGGWNVPSIMLNGEGKKMLLSVGLGQDVSFDLEMNKFHFDVIGLDQLEQSIDFARASFQAAGQEIELLHKGLWTHSGEGKFFRPRNSNHDSWSLTNIQQTLEGESMFFPVISLSELISLYPEIQASNTKIIKLDIEGAEVELLPRILDQVEIFDYLLVEMDFLSLITFWDIKTRVASILRARSILRALKKSGLLFIYNEGFNFSWVKQ
jgi:FkbM family methyltransferase